MTMSHMASASIAACGATRENDGLRANTAVAPSRRQEFRRAAEQHVRAFLAVVEDADAQARERARSRRERRGGCDRAAARIVQTDHASIFFLAARGAL